MKATFDYNDTEVTLAGDADEVAEALSELLDDADDRGGTVHIWQSGIEDERTSDAAGYLNLGVEDLNIGLGPGLEPFGPIRYDTPLTFGGRGWGE